MKNLYAFTETDAPSLPAYVSINRYPGESEISVTVRARGEQYGSTIKLTEKQIYEMALALLKDLP